MIRAAAVALAVLVGGCATGGGPMGLTPEQQARCAAGGGCVLVTRTQLQGIFMQGAQAGVEAAEEQGCKPGGT